MKFKLSFLIVFLPILLIGQYDNTSFFFDKTNLDTTESFQGFKEGDLGYYDLESVDFKQMILTKDSISVRYGSQIIIPKPEALAKGYTFKEDKMYGVAPLNGVLYKEVNDTILALYYQYDSYFSSNGVDFVQPLDKGYLLFMQEQNGLYTVEYLEVKGSKMIIHSMDHSLVMDKLKKIKSLETAEEDGVTNYIANPTLKEFGSLIKSNCFEEKREYVLNKSL